MYRSSPFRSTLNTGYITCLGMCKVCTEAVHSVAPCPAKTAQTPKHGPGKKDRNRARGVFQGRRTSRSAGIYIYIYIFIIYIFTYIYIHIIHPQSLAWNLKMMISNRNLLLQWLIFRFHVKLQGCIKIYICNHIITAEDH